MVKKAETKTCSMDKGCGVSGSCCKKQCLKKAAAIFVLGVAIIFVGNVLSCKFCGCKKRGMHKYGKIDKKTCEKKLKWCAETGKGCHRLKKACSKISK